MNHANSILETFEYFCKITSKSIVTISSYTVSKLGRFFETQCSVKFQCLISDILCFVVETFDHKHRGPWHTTDIVHCELYMKHMTQIAMRLYRWPPSVARRWPTPHTWTSGETRPRLCHGDSPTVHPSPPGTQSVSQASTATCYPQTKQN